MSKSPSPYLVVPVRDHERAKALVLEIKELIAKRDGDVKTKGQCLMLALESYAGQLRRDDMFSHLRDWPECDVE